jgi:ubiquinone/menaquinone biosynthesis C-methylase UbiE
MPAGDAADVGCGTGRLSAMLARARAKGIPASFHVGSFQALPLADDSVDLVTCALALTHSTELRPAAEEFMRVVRPGRCVVTTDIHPITVATGGAVHSSTPGS